MKAAVISQWGDPDVFRIIEKQEPEIQDDQLKIKVISSSVNPVDWKQRKGNHKYILGSPFPIILGYDVCGEVVDTGKEISLFKKGDIVFGDLDNKYGGAFAEYAVGREKCFAHKPASIGCEEAGAASLVSLTALQSLRDMAGLKSGQQVLINGASGGVGHVAVQVAKIMGAEVIGVCSKRNVDFVKSLGADEVMDYQSRDINKLDLKLDVFFDVVGKYSFTRVKHLLNKGGVYINTHPRPIILIHKLLQPLSRGKKVRTILRKHSLEDMEQIASWLSDSKLIIHIDKSWPLEEISSAHAYAEKGRTIGKVSISVK